VFHVIETGVRHPGIRVPLAGIDTPLRPKPMNFIFVRNMQDAAGRRFTMAQPASGSRVATERIGLAKHLRSLASFGNPRARWGRSP